MLVVEISGVPCGLMAMVERGRGEEEEEAEMMMGAAVEVILLVQVVVVPFAVVLAVGIEEVEVAVAVHNLAEEVGSEMLMSEVVMERNDRQMLYVAQKGIEIQVFREQVRPIL